MRKKLSVTSVGYIYGFVHFSLELACFCFLFSRISSSSIWWLLALFYDALAFVPQTIIGVLKDKFPKLNLGIIGGFMVIVALILPWDFAALILVSIGNAFIHINGAHETLCGANGRLTPCGIFVGGGSFGVVLGQFLGISGLPYKRIIPIVLMAISLILMYFVPKIKISFSCTQEFNFAKNTSPTLIVLLMFFAVAVRAYIGYAIPTSWNKEQFQTILLYFAMGMGKAAGGVFADNFGVRKTAAFSSLCALPFILFGDSLMVVSLIGIAIFSMTMPITLGVLVSVFQKSPAFAFGITTLALFVGSAPAFFIRPKGIAALIIVGTLTLITYAALMFCINERSKQKNE